MSPARVVALARGWIGTPWCHGAACRGAGTDCLGLLRGIWRGLYGVELVGVPVYPDDWAETGRPGALLDGLGRVFVAVAPGSPPGPGEVLVFRLSARGPAQHLGVATECGTRARFVHACAGVGVVEADLGGPWRRRLVARFAFPGI